MLHICNLFYLHLCASFQKLSGTKFNMSASYSIVSLSNLISVASQKFLSSHLLNRFDPSGVLGRVHNGWKEGPPLEASPVHRRALNEHLWVWYLGSALKVFGHLPPISEHLPYFVCTGGSNQGPSTSQPPKRLSYHHPGYQTKPKHKRTMHLGMSRSYTSLPPIKSLLENTGGSKISTKHTRQKDNE